jgi:hypothetical protein
VGSNLTNMFPFILCSPRIATEAMEEDASGLAEAEDVTLDEAQIRKQKEASKQISKLKSWFNPDL